MPLLLSRLLLGFYALIPIPLTLVLLITLKDAAPVHEDSSMPIVFGSAATFLLLCGIALYVTTLRATSNVWTLAIGNYVAAALALSIPPMCFVASITYASVYPFAVSLLPTYAMLLLLWPRRRAWERAVESRQPRAAGYLTRTSSRRGKP